MDIPSGALGNPSLWGARIWVPGLTLAAADGRPTPALMYHLRTQLDQQLKDPQGVLNRQVCGRARRCLGVRVGNCATTPAGPLVY
jgi:hypothetical protein